MKTLFITGASGFIGRHLLAKIDHKAFDTIYCLSRTGELPGLNLAAHPNIRVIRGDLFDAHAYTESLASSDVVLHLAAVTGKAKPEEYFHVIVKGTEFLVRQCERLGVKGFLLASTIAVKYPDVSRYYYAQSKKIAEKVVKESRLSYSILRPTIVIGKDGPIWLKLSKLARAPFPFIFGDGKARIQPIYVEDLVDILISVIDNEIFSNETYDMGGPEILPFEEFIHLIHSEYMGKRTSIQHIPLKPLLYLLGTLEKFFYSFLPVTTGQLSPFRYNSVADPNPLHGRHAIGIKSPEGMIRTIVAGEKEDLALKRLYHECKVFCHYLVNTPPIEYVSKKYADAQRAKNSDFQFRSSSFDRFLIKFSQWNTIYTRVSDSYTRVFSKHSVFRKKLILLLAILETTSPHYKYLDTIDSSSMTTFYISLFKNCFIFGSILLLSLVILGPVHILLGAYSKFRTSH
jgi:NADH dehydrogenase